ncbi:MAG: hypothetical protein E7223_00350 [Clostridiales bacterium]|nr:hypothetical protein [Clostridiales bacterium]
MKALNLIGYGLYVITCNDGKKDNACIVNTVCQQTGKPRLVSVTINKANYTHDVVLETGKLNVNFLSEEAPFRVFKDFGFRSGRDVNKFEGKAVVRSKNGLVVLPLYINAYLSLEVKQSLDLGTHTVFLCEVTADQVFSSVPSMTYAYYHEYVKPGAPKAIPVSAAISGEAPKAASEPAAAEGKPESGAAASSAPAKKKGYVCTICGYVYEGDSLPADFVCPLCKHGAEDFVPIV